MGTERQIAFMKKLTVEKLATNAAGDADPEGRTVADILALLGDEGVAQYWDAIAAKSVKDVSVLIDRLMAAPSKQKQAARPNGRGAQTDVPQGHYAVPSLTGNNDLDFVRVDRPTEGRWEGYTFVKRIIGGHPDVAIRGKQAQDLLAAIAEFGVKRAAETYAHEFGRCYVCNRTLTDETSRALGIGPDCRARVA